MAIIRSMNRQWIVSIDGCEDLYFAKNKFLKKDVKFYIEYELHIPKNNIKCPR